MSRGEFPRTDKWKSDISAKLTGRTRTLESRARISAGKKVDKRFDPVSWKYEYDRALSKLKLLKKWEEEQAHAAETSSV